MANDSTDSKYPWQSKTLWSNLAAAVIPFIPHASDWVAANPQAYCMGLGVLNMALRFVSQKKISFDWSF